MRYTCAVQLCDLSTTQTNAFFVAYYRQPLNNWTTRPGFFVAYYGQPLNKQMTEPKFFVAYHGQPLNRNVPGSILNRRSAGLRDPTSLRGSRWPSGRKCKRQWLTSGEWGCPLDNDPKLAVGQPNSS